VSTVPVKLLLCRAGLACLVSVLGWGSAAAQPAAPREALSLEQVLAATIEANTALKVAALEVDLARGTTLAEAAPFDSAVVLTGVASRRYQFSVPPAPPATILGEEVTLGAGWSKRFRNGLTVAPVVNVTRAQYDRAAFEDTRASANLRLALPLLRDFGGAITAAPERAARAAEEASVLEQRQALAVAVLQAAVAYWRYLALHRRLEVVISSEGRAARTAVETDALVEADERTRADLAQAQGYLSSRRALRMAAEQDLLEAWEDISILSGQVRSDLSSLPGAATDFPGAGPPPSNESRSRWFAAAPAHRPDLAAAERRMASAEVQVRAARNGLWPRLDLAVTGGYSGDRRGMALADPPFRPVPGPEGSVQLSLELPIQRSGARGALAQQEAVYQRERLGWLELERQIRIRVASTFEMVRRSRLALNESQEAVRLLQQTVESEKQKFRLGSSTLLAVIQAEDTLTSALLAQIEGQRSFAVALVNLRFETGTLFPAPPAAADTIAALARRLTVLP
jgi:outer membrane protein